MMVINKLVIDGFKSFQRKTAIPFFQGITAVVGENGSGKSNVTEAFHFVLGKRSSGLRADKLEHLIYNGGKGKKARDFAEVTLHLSNSSGIFNEVLNANEFPMEKEITIGRKVTKSYATYKFMGKNCQRDVVDKVLRLLDLDVSGHHFIKQEEVTNIVKKGPVERRKVIDDISGISEYEEKKEMALNDLETVEEKIKENNILLEERHYNLKKLRQEKQAADKYFELEKERKELETAVLNVREIHLTKNYKKARKRLEELKIQHEELGKNLSAKDIDLLEYEKKIEELDKRITSETGYNLVKDVEKLKNSVLRKKDEIEVKRREIEAIKHSIEEIKRIRSFRDDEPKAVKALLNLNSEKIYGTFKDLMKVPERFSTAIQTASMGHLNDLVVENREIALKCINYLKQNNAGRARILPIDKLLTRPFSKESQKALHLSGVIDYAINLVNFEKKHEAAFHYVFQDTLVAENLESVKNAQNVPVVTLDGDLLSRGGAMTGGSKISQKQELNKKGGNYDISEKEMMMGELENEIGKLKVEIGDINKLLEKKAMDQKNDERESNSLWKERKELVRQLDKLREKRSDNYLEVSRIKMEINQLESSTSHYESEIGQIQEEMRDLEIQLDEQLIEKYSKQSVEDLKKKRNNIIKRLNSYGAVNMRSIEEYEVFEKEFNEFKEKLDKIKGEKEEILNLIKDVEEKKREKFFDTLNKVASNFSRIFSDLFTGGEASMHLQDADDLNSGLIIKAHPPGKKVHTIDSLSGGEKTLTAVAFVMAIQELRPSPFYIMDEIDAQLDGENAKKVSQILKKYSEQSQVILISHNQETIRNADRIYGVTMVDGVSKIRSIDLKNN